MSSTPVTPAPATSKPATPAPTIAQDIATDVKKIGVWLDPMHIVLVIALILASLGGVYLFESKEAAASEARAQIATQVANAAQAASASQAIQNAAIQEQAKEVEAALTAANAQLAQANAQLIASNKQITTALVAQQAKVPTLPPAQQATLWEQLEPKATVTLTPSGFAVDQIGGVATIQDLQELPADRQKLTNFQAEVDNDLKEITNANAALAEEKKAHASDVAAEEAKLTAETAKYNELNDNFTTYKHKARRNYIKAFFLGFVAGVIGGHAAGF
jgi:hypothetical protein